MKLAGGWAAWQTNTGYELLDRATGTRTTFDVAGLPGERQVFDVSPEGVLAVALSVPGGGPAQLAWTSPAEPTWHVFSVPGLLWDHELRVRGGRIARVTWATTTCDTLTVTARPVADGPFTLPARTHCPVVVDPRRVGLGHVQDRRRRLGSRPRQAHRAHEGSARRGRRAERHARAHVPHDGHSAAVLISTSSGIGRIGARPLKRAGSAGSCAATRRSHVRP